MQPAAEVSPELFWEHITGYQRTAVLRTAVELGLFTAIGDGARTAAEIARAAGASERGVRTICDALTVMGMLQKAGNDYALTPSSAVFLSRSSPAYLGSVTDFLASPYIQRGFDTLTEAVKNGGSVVTGDGSVDPESPMWVTFARAMMPMMAPTAQAIADHLDHDIERPLRILDIAAGHGIFGITLAQKFPNATVVGLDWKNVLEVAKENAEKFGVSGRYETIAGSAFDVGFGGGYDVILLTNFLHHFDRDACIALLSKCGDALNDGGKVLTLEFVPNDDRVSPPQEAMFSVVMLAGTPHGDAYTFRDLREMAEAAGFTSNEHIPLPPSPQHLIVSTK